MKTIRRISIIGVLIVSVFLAGPSCFAGTHGEARALIKSKKYKEAEAILTQLIANQPDNVSLLNDRARARTGLGDLSAAAADYNEAVRLEPNNTSIRSNRASFRLYHFKEYPGAIDDLTELLRRKPDDAYYIYMRGRAHQKAGHLKEALIDLDKSIALKEKSTSAHSARGAVLQQLGRESEAESAFRRALELNPKNLEAVKGIATFDPEVGKAAAEKAAALRARDAAEKEVEINIILPLPEKIVSLTSLEISVRVPEAVASRIKSYKWFATNYYKHADYGKSTSVQSAELMHTITTTPENRVVSKNRMEGLEIAVHALDANNKIIGRGRVFTPVRDLLPQIDYSLVGKYRDAKDKTYYPKFIYGESDGVLWQEDREQYSGRTKTIVKADIKLDGEAIFEIYFWHPKDCNRIPSTFEDYQSVREIAVGPFSGKFYEKENYSHSVGHAMSSGDASGKGYLIRPGVRGCWEIGYDIRLSINEWNRSSLNRVNTTIKARVEELRAKAHKVIAATKLVPKGPGGGIDTRSKTDPVIDAEPDRVEFVAKSGASEQVKVWIDNAGEKPWKFRTEYAPQNRGLATVIVKQATATSLLLTLTEAGLDPKTGDTFDERSVLSIIAEQKGRDPLQRDIKVSVGKEGLYVVHTGRDPEGFFRVNADGQSIAKDVDFRVFIFDPAKKQLVNQPESVGKLKIESLEPEDSVAAQVIKAGQLRHAFAGIRSLNELAGIYRFTMAKEVPGDGRVIRANFKASYPGRNEENFSATFTLGFATTSNGPGSKSWQVELERCQEIIDKFVPAKYRPRLQAILDRHKMTLGAEGLNTLRGKIWRSAVDLTLGEGGKGYADEAAWADRITVTLEWAEWAGDMAFGAVIGTWTGPYGATGAGMLKTAVISALRAYQAGQSADEWLWENLSTVPGIIEGKVIDPETFEQMGVNNKAKVWAVYIGYHFLKNIYNGATVVEALKNTAKEAGNNVLSNWLGEKVGRGGSKAPGTETAEPGGTTGDHSGDPLPPALNP